YFQPVSTFCQRPIRIFDLSQSRTNRQAAGHTCPLTKLHQPGRRVLDGICAAQSILLLSQLAEKLLSQHLKVFIDTRVDMLHQFTLFKLAVAEWALVRCGAALKNSRSHLAELLGKI